MLAFQRLYLFILMSGYATEESHLTFRDSPGGHLELPLSFYHFLFFSTIADFLPIISEIFPSFTIYSSNSPIYPSS